MMCLIGFLGFFKFLSAVFTVIQIYKAPLLDNYEIMYYNNRKLRNFVLMQIIILKFVFVKDKITKFRKRRRLWYLFMI